MQKISSFLLVIFYFTSFLSFASDSISCNQHLLAHFPGQETATENDSFLLHHLLKKNHLNSKNSNLILDDLNPETLLKISKHLENKKIFTDAKFDQRLNFIASYPIEDIIAAPGHRQLRNKAQVNGLVEYIKNSGGGDFTHDKILLNIITDQNGDAKYLDLWNAHHRLVAYLKADYKTIGDINPKNLEILVNGQTVNQEMWGHFLSAGGTDFAKVKDFGKVAPSDVVREGTISVNGALSNVKLGSKNSLKQLAENTFKAHPPKVGVYFGTFNPFHEGHLETLLKAKKGFGLDEVLIVPNVNPSHKKDVLDVYYRNHMISERIKDISGVNLYIGDSSEVIDRFGRNPFFERVTQTYGTYDLHQIIGDDSFMSFAKEGKLQESKFRKYLVFKRKDGPELPDFDPDLVTIVNSVDELGISSTKIKELLKSGLTPTPKQLHPDILKYITEKDLYR